MEQNSLLIILVLFSTAIGAVLVAHRFKLPALLACLLVGIALGPYGLKVLAQSKEVDTLAEFGVVFLMFSIGLEFNLNRLKSLRAMVIGFGGLQVGLTALATTLVALYGYGQHWEALMAFY